MSLFRPTRVTGRSKRARRPRARALGSERGGISAEYVALLALVVAILAAIPYGDIRTAVQNEVEDPICAIATDRDLEGGCGRDGERSNIAARDGVVTDRPPGEGRGLGLVGAERAALPAPRTLAAARAPDKAEKPSLLQGLLDKAQKPSLGRELREARDFLSGATCGCFGDGRSFAQKFGAYGTAITPIGAVRVIGKRVVREAGEEIAEEGAERAATGARRGANDPPPVRGGAPMLGEGGVQTTSSTLLRNRGRGFRVDVENPAPGTRPGQLHLQDDTGRKYLYDFDEETFRRDVPRSAAVYQKAGPSRSRH